jgi:hypothetical protein
MQELGLDNRQVYFILGNRNFKDLVLLANNYLDYLTYMYYENFER